MGNRLSKNKNQKETKENESVEDVFKTAKGKRSDFMFASITDALEKALEDAKEFNKINRKKVNRVRLSGVYFKIAIPYIMSSIFAIVQYTSQNCPQKTSPLYIIGFSVAAAIFCLMLESIRRSAIDREKDKEIHQLLSIAKNISKYKSGKSLWEVLADDKVLHSFGARFVATYRDGEWYPVPDNLLLNGDIILLFDGDTAPALLSQILEVPQHQDDTKSSLPTSMLSITIEGDTKNDMIQPGEIIKKGAYPHIQNTLKQLKLDHMTSVDLSGFAGLFRVKSTPIYDYSFAFLVAVPDSTTLNSQIVKAANFLFKRMMLSYNLITLITSIARYFVRPHGISALILFLLRLVLILLSLSSMTAPFIQALMENLSARLILRHVKEENKDNTDLDAPEVDPFQSNLKRRSMASMLFEKNSMWKVREGDHPMALRENAILDLEQLVHNLGAITSLCVLNEHVVMAERASCDEMCFFNKDKNILMKELEYDPSTASGLRFKDLNLEKNPSPLKSIGICCGLETLQFDNVVYQTKDKSKTKNDDISPESSSRGNSSSLTLYDKLINENEHGDVLNFIGFERVSPAHMKALAVKIGIDSIGISRKFKVKKRFIFYDKSSLPSNSTESVFASTSHNQSDLDEKEVYGVSNIASSFKHLLSTTDTGKATDDNNTPKPKYHTFLFGDSRLFIQHAPYVAIDGKDIVAMSNDDKKAIETKENQQRRDYSDYVSFSYSVISPNDAKELINYQTHSDHSITVRLPCPDIFQPYPPKSTPLSNMIPQNILDAVSNVAKSQIFLGMTSSSGKPRARFPQFVSELKQSGIRFVDFSPRNVSYTKHLLASLGVDADRCIPLSLIKGDKVRKLLDVPDGIDEIKKSLNEGNDLALRVNAFANSSQSNIKEMIKVMKANGEIVGVVGGGDKSTNIQLFLESSLAIGIVSDTQSASQRAMDKRRAELGRRLSIKKPSGDDEVKTIEALQEQLQIIEYSAGLSFAVTTLPCAIVIHGEARYSHITKILLEGRTLLYNIRQAMALYFAMSLMTGTLIMLSYLLSIDLIFNVQTLLLLQWVQFPMLCVPIIYNFASSDTSNYIPSKKNEELWDHIDSKKRLLTITFYAFIRIFPTALFIVALYCGIYVDSGITPPNNYSYFNESLVLWGPYGIPRFNPAKACTVGNPKAKVSPACIAAAADGFVQFAYMWALVWTAATFVQRTDNIWNLKRRNNIWWISAFCTLLIQFGISCIPVSDIYGCNSSLLWLTLPNPYAWIAVILWPIVVIGIAEACKYHDGKALKKMREDDRTDFNKPLITKKDAVAVEMKS